MNWLKLGTFVGGVLFGTAGVSVLSSKDAKNIYTKGTAAVLRGKDCVMDKVATIQENCGDIYADAQDVNAERANAERERKYAEAQAIIEEYNKKPEEDEK